MTELGTCATNRILHSQSEYCTEWKPVPAPRVEIWRFNDTTLTVARTDGACWNGPDTMFANVKHNGVWDSSKMQFVHSPTPLGPAFEHLYSGGIEIATYKDGVCTYLNPDWEVYDGCLRTKPQCFSDGTPVALYEGQQPVIDLLDAVGDIQ
jgi:hypothetical protein